MKPTEELPLDKVNAPADIQPRAAGIDRETVDQYAADMKAKCRFPDVVVYFDGSAYWLSEGFHRHAARRAAGFDTIRAEVRPGTKDDARWNALASNQAHGLRRTNEDKRKAATDALAMRPEMSDSAIADHCGVSQPFVGSIRKQVITVIASPPKRTGKDGKKYPARKPPKPPAPAAPKTPAKTSSPPAADDSDPVDAFKNPVPAKRRDVLFDPWIQEDVDALAEISERFRAARFGERMEKKAKRYPFFDAKDYADGVGFVIQYLDQLISHLKSFRPAAVCPDCEGAGCGSCRMSGLVSRDLYAQLKK